MVHHETFRQLALAFPEASVQPHFEKISYRVGKKIFATLDTVNNRACLKLSEIDQDVFSNVDRDMICPVPNKWGTQGWTFFDLKKVPKHILADALRHAYCEVAPKKLSETIMAKSKF